VVENAWCVSRVAYSEVSLFIAYLVRLFLGGLCCHRIPQRPRRFRLLLVMLKLLTINDTLVASSGFCSTFPAKPLPAWTSASKSLSMTVEDSMFFTAALRVGLLVARTDLSRRRSRSVAEKRERDCCPK